MDVSIHYFDDAARPAKQLAQRCNLRACTVHVHAFPDGESLVRVQPSGGTVLLYRSLDDPNRKLVELLLAASALRDAGASRVILVAPYLAYMRQDAAFHPGEAISQRAIGALLAKTFDGLVTIDPHLHRTPDLASILPGIPALAVSAAPAMVEALRAAITPDTVLVGPDTESRPWVESIANPLGLSVLIGEKRRSGDRSISLSIPGMDAVAGRRTIIVDDCVSSGSSLIACCNLLKAAGAASVEAVVTHCLASDGDIEAVLGSGIAALRAADTTSSRLGAIPVDGVLADAMRRASWIGLEPE